MFKTGQIVGGDFEVLDLVGQGGMGFVFRARQLSLDRIVCLKVPRHEVRADANAMVRFEREAKTVARLNHPNIVSIFIVHLPKDPEDVPYLVMEFVEGKNLEEHIYTHRSELTVGSLLDILLQICDGLEAAHGANIIHRDIKPANIVISKTTSTVKIMDFGIARIQSSLDTVATSTVIVGTPAFMSPEQVRGERPTPASDLYSLGAMLYVFLAQRPLFEGTATTVAIKQITDTPDPIRNFNRFVTPELDELILRCLNKDPQKRPARARELAAAFDKILRPLADQPIRYLIPETTNATDALAIAEDAVTWYNPALKRKALAVQIVAAVIALALIGVWGWQVALKELLPYRAAVAAETAKDAPRAEAAYRQVLRHATPSWLPFLSRDARANAYFARIAADLSKADPWQTLDKSWELWLDRAPKDPALLAQAFEEEFKKAREIGEAWKRDLPADSEALAYAQAVAGFARVADDVAALDEARRSGDPAAVRAAHTALAALLPENRKGLFDEWLAATATPPPGAALGHGTGIARVNSTPDPRASSGASSHSPASGTMSPPTPVPTPEMPPQTPVPTASPEPTPSAVPTPVPTSSPSPDSKVASALVEQLDAALVQGASSNFFQQGFADAAVADRFRDLLNRLRKKQYEIREARHTINQFALEGDKGIWKGSFTLRGRLPANIQLFDIATVGDVQITLVWRDDRWLIENTTLPLEDIGD